MRVISGPELACAVSAAGGLGFLGGGTDVSTTPSLLANSAEALAPGAVRFQTGYKYSQGDVLPVGIGYLIWGVPDKDLREVVLPAIKTHKPAAVWLYAARGESIEENIAQLVLWTREIRASSPQSRVWIQVGSVAETRAVLAVIPDLDVLVVQGLDSGGHGLNLGAGLIALLPEVCDVVDDIYAQRSEQAPYIVAGGGLADARQVLASVVLGAHGVTLGTRFLATPEAEIHDAYKAEVVRANDGGQSTVRTSAYDILRGTPGWPTRYGGRGVVNQSWFDWQAGKMDVKENTRLYEEALKQPETGWGPSGRLCTYAGTGVGLVKNVSPAGQVVQDLLSGLHKLSVAKLL